MLRLRAPTKPIWLETVLGDFTTFLQDHAANERKAAQSALQLVAHYPDRRELVEKMLEVAREELEHFDDTYRRLAADQRRLAFDRPDPYMGALHRWMRKGKVAESLLDRMLVFSVVEARGCERFFMLANAFRDGAVPGGGGDNCAESDSSRADPNRANPGGETLAEFYRRLAESEGRHQGCFHALAYLYFPREEVDARIADVLSAEAIIFDGLKIRPALH